MYYPFGWRRLWESFWGERLLWHNNYWELRFRVEVQFKIIRVSSLHQGKRYEMRTIACLRRVVFVRNPLVSVTWVNSWNQESSFCYSVCWNSHTICHRHLRLVHNEWSCPITQCEWRRWRGKYVIHLILKLYNTDVIENSFASSSTDTFFIFFINCTVYLCTMLSTLHCSSKGTNLRRDESESKIFSSSSDKIKAIWKLKWNSQSHNERVVSEILFHSLHRIGLESNLLKQRWPFAIIITIKAITLPLLSHLDIKSVCHSFYSLSCRGYSAHAVNRAYKWYVAGHFSFLFISKDEIRRQGIYL
jgi:hypothetical protein